MTNDDYKLIGNSEVGMIRGKRFSLKEIRRFEEAVMRTQTDGQIECMMLFFCETLHDVLDADETQIFRVMRRLNEHLARFMLDIRTPEFNIDDIRLRVYEKTNYIFAMSEDDRQHIRAMLAENGYDPDWVESEQDRKEEEEKHGKGETANGEV